MCITWSLERISFWATHVLSLTSGYHQYLLQHNNNSCRHHQRKQSNIIIRLLWTRTKNSDCFVVVEKVSTAQWERLTMCECVSCRRMVSQAAMRGQRVVESECRCWNPALWLLVSLLGSLVLVAVSVLLRLGECVGWGYHVGFVQKNTVDD